MKTLIIILLSILLTSCVPCKAQSNIHFPSKMDTVIAKDSVKNIVRMSKVKDSVVNNQRDSIHALHLKAIKTHKQAIDNDLYGGIDPVHFRIAFIFSLLAMFIRWGLTLRTIIKSNTDASVKFSWKLWGINSLHKIMRVMASLGLVFVFLRFSKELLGFEFSMLIAFAIGFFIDYLADKALSIKPETIFKKNIEIQNNSEIINNLTNTPKPE